jgi:two-component system, response regulator YesN
MVGKMYSLNEQIKILIVDDELPIREWLKFSISSIKNSNIEIVGVCKDGNEAIDLYINERPDICITDIKMPNMNGIELLKRIKEHDESAYVVMLTSHDDFELARESLKYGAAEYVLKNEIDSSALENIVNGFKAKHEPKKESKITYNSSIEIKSAFNGDYESAKNIIKDVGKLNNDQIVLMAHYKQGFDFSSCIDLGYKMQFIGSGKIYKYDKNKVVFIVQLKHLTSQMEKYNSILLFAKEIEALCGSSVGASEILNESTTIENAIKSSLYALGMSYYDKRPTCMYTWIKTNTDNTLKHILEKRKEIIEMISIMNFEKAKSGIAKLFDYVTKNKFADVETIKFALIDIIISLKLSKFEFSSEGLSELSFQYQEKINQATRIFDMERDMAKFINGVFEIEGGHDNAYSKYVNKSITFIKEKYASIELISDISDYLGLNLEYLCRLFKSETNVTLNNYLTNYRIKISCHLLKTTDLKVNEIGEMVGYNSLSYFSRIFRKKMNLSPHNYRLKLEENRE